VDDSSSLVSRALILSLQVTPDTKKEFGERYNQWSEMPLDELPIDEVRELLGRYDSALNELGRAENLMGIAYNIQLGGLSAPEMISTLLPELQEMRQLARLLNLRARLALAERRWEDVISDCRLGFRLAEVAGHSTDFLIGRLVGFAISGIMMSVLEEAIGQPDCPNLYWALASLPDHRLFETRDSIEFESVLLSRLFQTAGSLPDQPIGPLAAREKLRSLFSEANMTMFDAGGQSTSAETAGLLGGLYVVMLADPSREMLAQTQEWGERAKDLSAPEAVLRAVQLKFARVRDRWVAWSMLPPELWDEYAAESKDAFGLNVPKSDFLVALVSTLTPAVNTARKAGRRTEQQRNLLITLEAIRMHAAHTGQLPERIEKMRPVPAWNDTLADKPFGYHRSSPTRATLTRMPRYDSDPQTTFQIELQGTK
jgi:hypothetical protein